MFFFSVITESVPVHVYTRPPLTQTAEENVIAMLNRANGIIDRLKHTPHVTDLMRQLKPDLSNYDITVIRDQLKQQFEAALHQAEFPARIASNMALMFAHNAVEDIQIVIAKHGDSIVVYFLCKTDKSIYELGQMIMSGFMHLVFAAVIESVSPTTVEVNVYITPVEVDFQLLGISSPQDKGWSIAVWYLQYVNKVN